MKACMVCEDSGVLARGLCKPKLTLRIENAQCTCPSPTQCEEMSGAREGEARPWR